MSKNKVNQIIIGDKFIDEIIDENNVKWYPFNMFLNNILCKSDKVSKFRDSSIIRYMKVIEYSCDRPGMYKPRKIWCINEKGIKFLLKNMNVNYKGNTKSFKAREKGFAEACLFFNVKKTIAKIDPLFVNGLQTYNLENYDIWSATCIKNDNSIDKFTKWKKCPECEYYYPYTDSYFGKKFNQKSKCLQCKNSNFKCKNKIIQFIYENNGINLLMAIYDNNEELIIKELKKIINGGE